MPRKSMSFYFGEICRGHRRASNWRCCRAANRMNVDATALSKWFQERPFWLREALNLVLANGALTQENLLTLAETCRTHSAVQKATAPDRKSTRLNSSHLGI